MNFKTKAFGFVAGTALALSLTSGVVAAVDGNTTANLDENVTGACFASVASGNIFLGTWVWDGDSYEDTGDADGETITFDITQTVRPTPAVNCNVAVLVSDLVQGVDSIPAANVDLAVTSGSASAGSPYTVVTDADGTDLVLTATLTAVPNDIPEGTYAGTVTVTSATAGL